MTTPQSQHLSEHCCTISRPLEQQIFAVGSLVASENGTTLETFPLNSNFCSSLFSFWSRDFGYVNIFVLN